MKNIYYVYILTNYQNTTLYIGVTNNLIRRVTEHRTGEKDGFSKKYNLNKLVYFDLCEDVQEAIRREKQLKNWRRQWKLELIEKLNPKYEDLYDSIFE